MGTGASSITPTPESFEYFCLTFHWVDTIRLIHANARTTNLIREAITSHWKGGLNHETTFYGALDLEVQGRPFAKGIGIMQETLMSKKAVCHLLAYLMADGWNILRSSDLSRTMDLTSWFLKKGHMGTTATLCCLSLSNTDGLQLISAPKALFEALKKALHATYAKGIKGGKPMGECDFQVKLNGNPWTSEEEEGMDARKFLLELIRRFQTLDYYLYGTVNLKGTADSLFFVHHQDNNCPYRPGEYCMLSLNQTDRLRLVDCPEGVHSVVRDCINRYRGKGALQRESDFHGTWEFKLRGTPWCAEAQDVVYARLFIAKLLESLYAAGWRAYMTVDMSRKMNDKAVIILKSIEKPKKAPHFCISPANMDTIRVIGAPPQIAAVVRHTLNKYWPLGIQSEDPDYYGSHEFKLKGQPWSGRQGVQGLHIRSFMCFLIHNFEGLGWEPVASVDVTAKHINSDNGPDYPVDVHSWFFGKTF